MSARPIPLRVLGEMRRRIATALGSENMPARVRRLIERRVDGWVREAAERALALAEQERRDSFRARSGPTDRGPLREAALKVIDHG